GADQLHELFHAVVVIPEPEARGGDAEAGVVGGDAEIAVERHAHSAAHAHAVDHGEERLRHGGEGLAAARGDAPVLGLVRHVAAPVLELGDVGAGDEGLIARAPQDDHTYGIVRGQIVHVTGHELPHLLTHRVPLLRLIEDDPADRSVLLQQQGGRGAHGESSWPRASHTLTWRGPPRSIERTDEEGSWPSTTSSTSATSWLRRTC